jgi:hypothetical protein
MDPDTHALLTVTRSQLKAVRRQVSTLARLLAELEHRLGPDPNPRAQEANGHGSEHHQ